MTLLTALNPVKNWNNMLVNQRIPFTTLLATMGAYITGTTNQLIASGYTCVGSSNGVAAAMDGVNRCTTAAGFAVRGATTTTAQSWIVVSDGTTQTLFAYTGATTDDCARVSYSPGSLFTIAGTPTFAPTATDELILNNGGAGTSLIGTGSNDRIFNVWCDSTHKYWRTCVFSLGIVAGRLLGVEPFDVSPLSGITCNPAVWGFVYSASNTSPLSSIVGAYNPNLAGGICKTSGNGQTQLGGATLVAAGNFAADAGILLNANGSQFGLRSIGNWSASAGAQGLIGQRIDWWATSDLAACGALGGPTGKEWVVLNTATVGGSQVGILWPWNGVTTSVVTS